MIDRTEFDEIEITSEMKRAGLKELYNYRITEPDEEELLEAVSEVFKAMISARPKARRVT